ncbi:hypothetical protein BFJ65_g16550 [Fusarium oxysporum f. sp. cepae]|uniref:Uncharacterized protein n=1 Tax=Fusarium oxysporum f. sp. cepae TaxID=396571 RepID=A0A3L6MWZ7_FUSOX|nr:hypothetical protein BFJ65_g16550 [Fusarium oxysporum f. sp. cepae]RKK21257.1 hypothetical protein BFJ67_g17377 [Fusarium oxysporum f. sp. cepae]
MPTLRHQDIWVAIVQNWEQFLKATKTKTQVLVQRADSSKAQLLKSVKRSRGHFGGKWMGLKRCLSAGL